MNEVGRAKKFLYSKLAGHAPLTSLVSTRIYDHPAPADSVWPVVTYTLMTAPDTVANGGVRVMTRCLFIVRGIAKGGSIPLAIADAIEGAIGNQQGVVAPDAYVPFCVRESGFDLTESSEGVIYRHLGGRYRIDVHAYP